MSKQAKRSGVAALVMFFVFAAVFVAIRWFYGVGVLARTDAEETAKITFEVICPIDNQIFQRSTEDHGDIVIKLQLSPSAPLSFRKHPMVRAAYGYGPWEKVIGETSGDVFFGVLKNQPVGRGILRIKVGDFVRVTHGVLVGDVFVPIGQSNAVGAFLTPNKLKGGTKFQPVAYCEGRWVPCEDPINPYVIAQVTKGLGGSVWPLVAQSLAEADPDVPIGFVDVSLGATGLVKTLVGTVFEDFSWRDQDSSFPTMVQLVGEATGGTNRVRAFLWFQGETDVMTGVTTEEYKSGLRDLVARMRRDLGPDFSPIVVVGQIGKIFANRKDSSLAVEGIRLAQREIIDGQAFFPGPDGGLVTLGEDQLHFQSEEAAEKLASLWVESIQALPPLPSESNEHELVASK